MAITRDFTFNSYRINKLEIDGHDVSNQFYQLVFEEGIFIPFIYGTLVLNKQIFAYPDTWENKELGWINRKISIEWETVLFKSNAKYLKKIDFVIYSMAEETEESIILLFIQKPAFNFYNLNFCTGWNDTEISTIIKDIMNVVKYDGLTLDIDTTETKISFTNPLIWTPIKTILYLLPMMRGTETKDYGYFFFSSSNNKINCKSINSYIKEIKKDSYTFETLTSDDTSEAAKEDMSATEIIGRMLDFRKDNTNNILEELNNNIYGNILKIYNTKTKEITKTELTDNLSNITNFGDISNLHPNLKNYADRIKFYFNGINGKEVEINESIREFFNKNKMIAIAYGLNTRNIGDGLRLNLKRNNKYLEIENNEYSGRCVITGIKHLFDKSSYLQELTLVKPGLNKYNKPEQVVYV